MVIRSLLVVFAIALIASPAFSQFGQNRLTDLAARLSREAEDFADANYNTYTNASFNNRTESEAVVQTYQFAGASRIFYRMVVDRRRTEELRDAFDVLARVARTLEQNNSQRSSWSNIQQLLSDIGREVFYTENPGPLPPDTPHRSGRMSWRGRVDDDVRIRIRGGTADVETLGGTPYYDAQPNFENSLPNRRVTLRVTKTRGRGEIFIEQQPSRENNFTAIIRIKDTKGGADNYQFTLEW